MAMATQESEKLVRINQCVEQVAAQLGLIVLDLHLSGQGQNKSLTVCIYRKGEPIGFADCEAMSRSLEQLLELEQQKENLPELAGDFSLEIVSPGLERQLNKAAEFLLFSGSLVRILAKEKIDALGTEFVGVLAGGDEHSVIIEQAQPLPQKSAKKGKSIPPHQKSKGGTPDLAENLAGQRLVIDLKQIYRLNLCPDFLLR